MGLSQATTGLLNEAIVTERDEEGTIISAMGQLLQFLLSVDSMLPAPMLYWLHHMLHCTPMLLLLLLPCIYKRTYGQPVALLQFLI